MNQSSNTMNPKVIVITGASSGIGAAIARDLVAHGARVMCGARRQDRLEALVAELGTDHADYRVTDVTRQADVDALLGAAVDRFGRVDTLVNNAGTMPLSAIEQCRVAEWEQTIDVNVKGLLYGSAAALPRMLGNTDGASREPGHIINISSVVGHKVMAGGAVYCGTKFMVRAISEGLRMETAGRLRVTNISPGLINTELPASIAEPNTAEFAKQLYTQAISPDAIARAVRFAIAEPADVSVNEMIVRPTVQEL